ncbi:MAG TPA: hypothetical protein VEV44_09650 [Pseudoneobacillus sp.]|nr:hypothetical protein [Pseudoneobacillus sp.]
MDKNKNISTTDANMEMNKFFEVKEVHEPSSKMSISDTNIELQNEFYNENRTERNPTYVYSGVPSVRISGNDE